MEAILGIIATQGAALDPKALNVERGNPSHAARGNYKNI